MCEGQNHKPIESGLVPGAQRFSYAEIVAASSNFKDKIGSGGFGPVHYGRLPNGQEVAIKTLDEKSHQGAQEFTNEVNELQRQSIFIFHVLDIHVEAQCNFSSIMNIQMLHLHESLYIIGCRWSSSPGFITKIWLDFLDSVKKANIKCWFMNSCTKAPCMNTYMVSYKQGAVQFFIYFLSVFNENYCIVMSIELTYKSYDS